MYVRINMFACIDTYIRMHIYTYMIHMYMLCASVYVCVCILTPHASFLQSSRSRDETVLELINIFDEATRSAATTESLTSVDPSLQLSGYVVCTVLHFIAVHILCYTIIFKNISLFIKVIAIIFTPSISSVFTLLC